MSNLKPEKKSIVLVGDIHGEFNTLAHLISNRYKLENSYIIQVGDFGMGFYLPNYYKTELETLDYRLGKNNNHLYAIRGNHDDPEYFKKTNNPFGYKNITLLQDYSELKLLDKSILLIGGAVSVDRKDRLERQRKGKSPSYWIDEVFNIDSEFKYQKYDLVVTHTRPAVCGHYKGFANINDYIVDDPKLKDDLIEESQKVDILYQNTKPPVWVYGHFHQSIKSTTEDTTFRCLDINEFWGYFTTEKSLLY